MASISSRKTNTTTDGFIRRLTSAVGSMNVDSNINEGNERLPVIEAERIISILDDTAEKLNFLDR